MADMIRYGVAYTFTVALPIVDDTDFATSSDYTYASGDWKISKDHGAAANLTTTPTVVAMGTNTAVWKVTITATEAEAATIDIVVDDAAVEHNHWTRETYGHPSSKHPSIGIDIPNGTLSGTHTTTTADLGTNAPAEIPVGSLLVNLTTSEAVFVTAYATGTGVATFAALGTAWTDGDHWYLIYGAASGLATAANLASLETKVDAIDTVVDANKVILDKLPNGGALDGIESDLTAVKTAVQTTIPGTITTIDTVVDAVKAKTDSLTFTVSNQVDANIQSINDTTITGNGGSGTEFGV